MSLIRKNFVASNDCIRLRDFVVAFIIKWSIYKSVRIDIKIKIVPSTTYYLLTYKCLTVTPISL